MKSDHLFLSHVLGAIEAIERYSAGITLAEFLSQSLIQDAVIRQLEIIGEAVKNISGRARDGRPEIRWKEIAGMRDRLIHGYFGVDLEAVWLTIRNDLPALKRAVLTMLSVDQDAE
jgi:uncharacterized protein with HEPN domain